MTSDEIRERIAFIGQHGADWEIALQLALLNERQDEQWEFDQHQAALDEDDRATQETQRADTAEMIMRMTEGQERLISVFAPEPKGRPVAVVVPLADSAASTAPMSPGAAPADPSTSTNSGDQTKGIA